jgi:hypothetical protein
MVARLAVILALPAVLFASVPAAAVTLRAQPSLTLEESWDSNVLNDPDGTSPDWVSRASPRLDIVIETFGASLVLSGGVGAEKYINHDELDRNTASRDVSLRAREPVQITPRFNISPSARYVRTTDDERRAALAAGLEPGVPPPDITVTGRVDITEVSGSLSANYLMTPTLTVSASGGAINRTHSFDKPTLADNTDLVDSSTYTAGASFTSQLNPAISAGMFAEASFIDYADRANLSEIYTGGVSGSVALTPNHVLEGRLGVSYLKEAQGPSVSGGSHVAPSGRLTLRYDWREWRTRFTLAYEYSGGGSFGQTTERGFFTIDASDRFAEDWRLDMSGSIETNQSVGSANTEDLLTSNGRAGLRYAAAAWADVSLSGQIIYQRSLGSLGNDLFREIVTLSLTLHTIYPIFQ